jgi:hypothetical protein
MFTDHVNPDCGAGCNQPKSPGPGDLVMTGNNWSPTYAIIHIFGNLAWLHPIEVGGDAIVPLERLRRIDATAPPART